MGVPPEESSGGNYPAHEVTISSLFQMGAFEVTKAQWVAVMGTTPWGEEDYHPDSPAVNLDW